MPGKKRARGVQAPPETQPTEGAPQRPAKRGGDTDKSRRIRSVAFAVIAFAMVAVIGCMVASQFFDIALLDVPRRAVARVMTPIQHAVSSGTGWLARYIRRLKLRGNIEYEYEQLYNKYDELLNQVMLYDELQHQLDEYAELTEELQQHTHFDGIAAMVINSDSTNYFSSFTINVGTDQGVEDYMAVVKSGGLVGYTYNVTKTTAQVKGIIDSDASIAALIESTRDQGIVSGTLGVDGSAMCRMYYLSDDHLPRQGDRVVTSGVGMEFPKGIPVGVVRESTRGMDAGKAYVVIEPIVDFRHIEYVIVYRYQPAYAEDADEREHAQQQAYVTLKPVEPVPPFGAGVADGFAFGATASASPDAEPSPGAEPSPDSAPSTEVSASDDPDGTGYQPPATPTAPNLAYDDGSATPTPTPTASPTPTPTPTATFSLADFTIEEDE